MTDNRIPEIRAVLDLHATQLVQHWENYTELYEWADNERTRRIRAILDSAPPAPQLTHRCPADGMLFTPCCATAPFDLPATDRITADPDLVTCRATSERAIPEPAEGQNRG